MVSKGEQEGERVEVLGFSQAGVLCQAQVQREFSSLERCEHPCCLENRIDLPTVLEWIENQTFT